MGKKVHFRLEEGYEWGHGMSEEKHAIFEEKIKSLCDELNCSLVTKRGWGDCYQLEDYWGRLYCHPMDLSGFISEYKIDEIEEAIKEVGLNLVRTDIYEQVNFNDKREFADYVIEYSKTHSKEELRKEMERIKPLCSC